MKVSIILITYGRKEELLKTIECIKKYQKNDLELLILNNNSSNELEEEIKSKLNGINFEYEYFHDGINYGVALGRNYLIEKSKGEIIITLDDDIEVIDINCLVDKTIKYFQSNDVGVLSYKIINFYSKKALRHEIPHGKKYLNFKNNIFTYYFIGAGHAIKREVYDKSGMYPKDLGKYGGEELDLSLRIVDNGFKILYTADIEVFHKVSPNGRMIKKEEDYLRFRNRMIVIYRYYPIIYFITNFIIWSIHYIFKNKNISNIYSVVNDLKVVKVSRISKYGMKYLKNVKARLLY